MNGGAVLGGGTVWWIHQVVVVQSGWWIDQVVVVQSGWWIDQVSGGTVSLVDTSGGGGTVWLVDRSGRCCSSERPDVRAEDRRRLRCWMVAWTASRSCNTSIQSRVPMCTRQSDKKPN